MRNIYDTPPDFILLAQAVPAFAPFVRTTGKGTPTIDFKDDAALRALTAALLERDFHLQISLPADRLCPTIPGRLEYVLWMLEIAQLHSTDAIAGIDIGTGASAVYALLACRTLASCRMIGTEIDPYSLESARWNVESNGLAERVGLVQTDAAEAIFPELALNAAPAFDFTMCNPPFYGAAAEVSSSQSAKALAPFAICTGGEAEMITPGGEVAFVGRIVSESVALSARIRWFSSLVGKLSSVSVLIEQLQALNVDNYAIKDLTHGRTKRWLLAWSFQPHRLPNSIGRASNTPSLARLLPRSTSTTYHCPALLTLPATLALLSSALAALALCPTWTSPTSVTLTAPTNTWSRAARRARARGEDSASAATVFLAATLSLAEEPITGEALAKQVRMDMQWNFGTDHAAFTSLASHLARRLADEAAGREREESVVVEGFDAMDLS